MPPEINEPHISALINSLVYDSRPWKREDLTQEAWVAVMEAAAVYDQHPEWGTWRNTVLRVARWSILDALCLRHRHTPMVEIQGDIFPAHLGMLTDTHLDALALLDRLGELNHEIMLMRYRDGLSYDEIMARTGLPRNTLRKHIRWSLSLMRHW